MNDTKINIDIRCPNCQKKLCEVTGDANIKAVCTRCKAEFVAVVREGVSEVLESNSYSLKR